MGPQPVVDRRTVAWVDGRPRGLLADREWMRITSTARPFRYRQRFPDGEWNRGVHAFKDEDRRNKCMRDAISHGYVVQSYEVGVWGSVYGPILKSRSAILHAAARSRCESRRHAEICLPGKTWCAEHNQHGCGPDSLADYEQHGPWDWELDPFRLEWGPYSLLSDKPVPRKEGKITVHGVLRPPRYAKFQNPTWVRETP